MWLYLLPLQTELAHRLDTVGKQIIKEGKVEMPWGTIIESFKDEEAVQLRGEVAFYCAIDGRLCLQLMKHWSLHIGCLEEASVCCVNASTIIDTGKQVKIVSLILLQLYGEWIFFSQASGCRGGRRL